MKKISIFLLSLLLVSSIIFSTTSPTNIGLAQAGTITITGRWWYYFNQTHGLPIINALVEIYDEEPTGTDFLGSTSTDDQGYFTFGPIDNNDGPDEDGLDILVTINSTSSAARVVNPDDIVYSTWTTPGLFEDSPDGALNIGNWITPYDDRGAWWIFSIHFGLTRGWNYLYTVTGYDMPRATARWPYGDWPSYDPTNRVILLPYWAYWPDIILHEYGHYVMHTLYGYMPTPPGGPPQEHFINETSNNVTAWVEGWANFFPLVVQNDPDLTGWNLETPHWCSPNWDDGDEVEGRVAGALWDIFDSHDDGYDVLDDGFHRIWNVTRYQNPDTFQEFWDAWNVTYYTHPKTPSSPYNLQDWTNTLMAIFQNSIDYRGPGDVNGDGIVDIFDSVIIALIFGSQKGHQNWDQRADLDYNDEIDIYDLTIVSINLGNTYDC